MLKVLPENVYNLIAAGEVIQRPASVVKELMENSADAGASCITLIINDSGRTLIQVTDNGAGMTPQEAELCFLSHATSKIDNADDLLNISTFGFRGEALASIAACADVTLKTRKRGEEIGTEVHIAASKVEGKREISCAEGCNISVRNIFYNIPARRKFLKSDNTEYRQIVAEFTRVALTEPEIDFKLVNDSKEILHLLPGKSLKQRIADISGLNAVKELIDLKVDTTVVKISGLIGNPASAKRIQPNQYLFANGRFFRSPMLHRAVMKGYSNLIPDGYSPAYFIFFEVNKEETDVNIHPAKTEIKFENERIIFDILEAAVKESIGKSAFAPAIDFNTEGVPQEISSADGFNISKEYKKDFSSGRIAPPKINYDPLFNPFDKSGSAEHGDSGYGSATSGRTNSYESRIGKEENLLGENSHASVFRFGKEFLAAPSENGIMIVNIRRAKAKIIYEKYIDSLVHTKPAIQEELFPQTVNLDPASYSAIVKNAEQLKDLGFDIRPFGEDCVVLYGMPSDIGKERIAAEECVTELAHLITDEGNTNAADFRKKVALNVAKHSAAGSDSAMTDYEAEALINSLLKCNNPAVSPLGGYCFTVVTADELKKRLL